MSMPYTPSRLRNEYAPPPPPQRRGHFANKSLPVCPADIPIVSARPKIDAYQKRETAPISISNHSRRSEDNFGVVVRPFPESPTSSNASSSLSSSSIRPTSSSSIPQRVSSSNPAHNLNSSSNSYIEKPLPNPHRNSNEINNSLLPPVSTYYPSHSLHTKASWTIPAVYDPRDYSIEPMSYWSDDSDDSDAETEKKHKRGSSKLFESWRRSRNNKTGKTSTNTQHQQHHHQHIDDELITNLARMQ